jgi:ABC-type Na+ transport system ATPase subunit NatA
VRVCGERPRRYVERHGIGYLSELVAIPPRWTLEQALRRFALLAGVAPSETRSRIEWAIERLGIGEHRKKQVRQLSKGNLQRLGLAQALLHDERILILDEPTHGLDPVWTQRFRDIVLDLRREDRVVFIASHNLDELQRLADRVAIIDHGRLQRVVEVGAPSAEAVPVTAYRMTLVADEGLVGECFPGATAVGRGEWLVPPLDVAALNARLAALVARGGLLVALAPARTALEHHFREAVGER